MIESYPPLAKPLRQEFTPVLLPDSAFASLKGLQFLHANHTPNIRFDMKDLATAFVQVGINTPSFKELVLDLALENARQQLDDLQPLIKESAP